MRGGFRSGCLALVFLGFWPGCASNEPSAPSGPVGVPTPVLILADGFVRFQGERMPLEAFVLLMRMRVRAAGFEAKKKPFVQARVVSEEVTMPPGFVDQLYRAGVQEIRLGER